MASGAPAGRGGRARTLAVLGVTALAILAVSYLANRPSADGGGFTSVVLAGASSGPAPEIGKPAPPFEATTIEGRRVSLAQLRGRPLWITFGATWCQPCRAENPDIEAAYRRYRGDGLQIVSVFVNDGRSDIVEYAKRAGLTYPKVDDADDAIASAYRIVGIPSHFFVDASGVLREIAISSLDPETIEEKLATIGIGPGRKGG